MMSYNKELPISPMKKLKILSENQNIHNKNEVTSEFVTKYDTNNELKVKMSNLKPQEQIDEELEPLLQECPGQYVIFPINHADMWDMYKKLVENFWSTTENVEHLEPLNLNADELKFLEAMCSFYGTLNTDCGFVNQNFAEEFSQLIQVTEAKFYYGHQLFIQNIHFEMYNKLFQTIAKSETERNELYMQMDNKQSARNKRDWVKKWSDSSVSFADKLVASVCLHGLFFCTINLVNQWLVARNEKQNISHEIIKIFDKMAIDEDSHRDFSCLMISHLKNKPSKEFITSMIEEATQIEKAFLFEAIPFTLIGLTAKDVNIILENQSTILKLKCIQALNRTPKIKTVPSEKEMATSENKIGQKEVEKDIRFDEDF